MILLPNNSFAFLALSLRLVFILILVLRVSLGAGKSRWGEAESPSIENGLRYRAR